MSASAPRVSCLMVTQPVPSRAAFVRQSVADYLRQTHPDRELVIVLNGGDAATRAALLDHVRSLGRADVRVVEAGDGLPLGALRNVSLAEARGDLVCQWDDDDRYHPERVATQVALMRAAGAEAMCLEEVLQFFPATRTMYCINFRKTEPQAMPGSLLMRRDLPVRYPEEGPHAALGEDTALLVALRAVGGYAASPGYPHLYVYRSHGANTWSDEHHRMLARELALSRSLLVRREAALRAGLAPIDLGAAPIEVTGYNGVAFTLAPR